MAPTTPLLSRLSSLRSLRSLNGAPRKLQKPRPPSAPAQVSSTTIAASVPNLLFNVPTLPAAPVAPLLTTQAPITAGAVGAEQLHWTHTPRRRRASSVTFHTPPPPPHLHPHPQLDGSDPDADLWRVKTAEAVHDAVLDPHPLYHYDADTSSGVSTVHCDFPTDSSEAPSARSAQSVRSVRSPVTAARVDRDAVAVYAPLPEPPPSELPATPPGGVNIVVEGRRIQRVRREEEAGEGLGEVLAEFVSGTRGLVVAVGVVVVYALLRGLEWMLRLAVEWAVECFGSEKKGGALE
ncbi:hypothetical protein EDC01DRAFT_781619 [Geopyxis carbonaria]|nr:hypothetical protein EDC01DRAFT_781619 [Geopyxis carbonaria]